MQCGVNHWMHKPVNIRRPLDICAICMQNTPRYNAYRIFCSKVYNQLLVTALHWMQRCLRDRKAVCLSVTRVYCDKTNESSADILIPYETKMHLVFRHEEWLVGTFPCTWNFVTNWPRRFKNGDFQSIFAHSASPLRPSEKNVQLSLKPEVY